MLKFPRGEIERLLPLRKEVFSCSLLIASTTSFSLAHICTRVPPRAMTWAMAVPYAPPPSTHASETFECRTAWSAGFRMVDMVLLLNRTLDVAVAILDENNMGEE